MFTYGPHALPPVGRIIITLDGDHHIVDDVRPGAAPERGFVLARPIEEGIIASATRSPIPGGLIFRDENYIDTRPNIEEIPEKYIALPAHEYRTRDACHHCGKLSTTETYDDYVEEWTSTVDEGEPGHDPMSEEVFTYLESSCSAAYRPATRRSAADAVYDSVIDNHPISRATTYRDLETRTGLPSSTIAFSIDALIASGDVVHARAESGEIRLFRA